MVPAGGLPPPYDLVHPLLLLAPCSLTRPAAAKLFANFAFRALLLIEGLFAWSQKTATTKVWQTQ